MAFKLEQMNVLNPWEYQLIYNLNVSDKYKSLVLSVLVFDIFAVYKYLRCKNLFDSDRKLWHLSISIRQRSYRGNYF